MTATAPARVHVRCSACAFNDPHTATAHERHNARHYITMMTGQGRALPRDEWPEQTAQTRAQARPPARPVKLAEHARVPETVVTMDGHHRAVLGGMFIPALDPRDPDRHLVLYVDKPGDAHGYAVGIVAHPGGHMTAVAPITAPTTHPRALRDYGRHLDVHTTRALRRAVQ